MNLATEVKNSLQSKSEWMHKPTLFYDFIEYKEQNTIIICARHKTKNEKEVSAKIKLWQNVDANAAQCVLRRA